MTHTMLVAGSGGQGIMLLGKILAEAAALEGKRVTWIPAYGAEVRGGTAHCMVTVSDREIGSPCFEKADTMIIMNEPSFEKFKCQAARHGLLLLNTSFAPPAKIKGVRLLAHPFTDIAAGLGNIKVANMVALGCFIRHRGIVKPETLCQVMRLRTPPGKEYLFEVNKKALEEGMRLG